MTTPPWLDSTTAPYLKFYHYDSTRKNTSAIYAPALDRFILVDNCDFWVVFEVAKIMSSKIATQVFLLTPDVLQFTNDSCVEYTINDKSQYIINGSNIVSARQTPILNTAIGSSAVVNVGLPDDFQNSHCRTELEQLLEYVRFVLRCVHAINFTDGFVHVPSIEEMLRTYCPELVPAELDISLNYTSIPGGMKQHVKSILYDADSVDDALGRINAAWEKYSIYNNPVFKEIFNYFLGAGQVPQLK